MRALVTGSEGFLGRHFVAELEKRYHVTGVDVTNGVDCRKVFAGETRRYDLVVHCAAQIPDREHRAKHPLSIAVNLELDAAMFDWALRTRQRRVVFFSSCAAYPIRQPWQPFKETDIDLGDVRSPDALYGWEKLTGEQLAFAARGDGLKVTVVRPFSGYGADQSLDYPFPSFVARGLSRDDPFCVWGSGKQTRDWVHVDDVVGCVAALVKEGVDGPVNIGTGRPTTMTQLAHLVCSQIGYLPHVSCDTSKPGGAPYRVADTTLMRQFYEPKVTLEEGIARALVPTWT